MSTLKDVAKRAGVTVTTVSRVINNRGYISDKTRKKVYDVMREIGYQPNEVARSLSKQYTNMIGVIVPHIMHPYFAKLISGIEAAAAAENCKIIICNSRQDENYERRSIEMFRGNQVCGIILCSGSVSMNEMMNPDIPIVTVECGKDQGDCRIQCDNYQGGILAAEHLVKCGCKEIIHFSGTEKEEMPADRRCLGFREVCEKYHIIHHEIETSEKSYYNMEYTEYITKILQKYPETDGIFASSDLIAAQAIQACSELGKKVPDDICIVGFDDVNLASLVTPALSTVRQPVWEMARMAVEAVINKRKGRVVPAQIVLPVTMIERNSTKIKDEN